MKTNNFDNNDYGIDIDEYEELLSMVPDERFLVFPYQIMDGAGLKNYLLTSSKKINDFGKKINNFNATDYLNKAYYKVPDKFRPSKQTAKKLQEMGKRYISPEVKKFANEAIGEKAVKYIENRANDLATNKKEVSVGQMMKDFKESKEKTTGAGMRKKRVYKNKNM